MKKTLLAWSIALLCVPVAHANEVQEALATCSAMKDDTARLACFDQLVKDFQESTETPTTPAKD